MSSKFSPVAADLHLGLIATPLRSLLRREPVTIGPGATIRQAAELMRAQRVSSVLIVEQGRLVGIVTDRDLRNRALAGGVPPDRSVMDIATAAPLTIPVQNTGFDALLLMARQNIHHVPVVDGQNAVGMITASDLTERQSTSAVYVAGEIYKQSDLEGLQRATTRIREVQRNLSVAGASAHATGHVISAITDALTTRLLQLAESRLGPPPVPYAWVAAGSQARSEQSAKSDQDNCMVLDDRYDPAAHGAYFESLSREVCAGLDACGYVYCPGDMMAQTADWRLPLHRWKELFWRWTTEPDPQALMLTCVFFDLRCIYGEAGLLDDLRAEVLERTRANRIFLAYMAGNALTRQPPLNMFGKLKTSRGDHRGTVDLKLNGIVPIVDLARVYALAGGHAQVNTTDRLEVAAQGAEVSEQGARDLRDALEFLGTTRIRHQVRQLDLGQSPDNFLAPAELSNFERTQLKDAFEVVKTLQSVLAQRYR